MASLYAGVQHELEIEKHRIRFPKAHQLDPEFCLRAAIEDCIADNLSIDSKLARLREEATTYHQQCNFAKFLGTTATCAGAAVMVGSFVAAPFTAGLSLVGGFAGPALSIGGGVTNVVTELYANSKTNEIIKSIEKELIVREESHNALNEMLKKLEKMVRSLREQRVEEVQAMEIVLKGLANNTIDLNNLPDTSVLKTIALSAVAIHQTEDVALKFLPRMGHFISISEKHLRMIYSFFGLTTNAGNIILRAAGQVIGMVSSVAFAAVDLTMMIRGWDANPPTNEVICDVQKQLRTTNSQLVELSELIQSLQYTACYIKLDTCNIHIVAGSELIMFNFLLGIKNTGVLALKIYGGLQFNLTDSKKIDEILKNTELESASKVFLTSLTSLIRNSNNTKKVRLMQQGVLTLYSDIIDLYVKDTQCNIKQMKDYALKCPFSSEAQQIISNISVFLPNNLDYVNANALVFQATLRVIHERCVQYMKILVKEKVESIEEMEQLIVMCFYDVFQHSFVDYVAFSYWTQANKGSMDVECVRLELESAILGLPVKCREWAFEIERLRKNN